MYRSYVKLDFKNNLFYTIFAKNPFFYQKTDIYRLCLTEYCKESDFQQEFHQSPV